MTTGKKTSNEDAQKHVTGEKNETQDAKPGLLRLCP